jgi:hypothetical protein
LPHLSSTTAGRNRRALVWLIGSAGVGLIGTSAVLLWSPAAFSAMLRLAAQVRQAPVQEEWAFRLRQIVWEVLSVGTVAVGGAAAIAFSAGFTAILASRRVRIGAAGVVMIIVQGISAWHRKSVLVDGSRVWFLDDDAMISMRYARNLAEGDGLVWNAGERVEGYSNFLWTFLMAGIHWIGLAPETTAAFVLAVNVALSCALLVQLDRLSVTLGVPSLLIAAPLMLAAISRELLVWSLSGLETLALALLCTFALARLTVPTRAPGPSAYVALALLPLVRADGIVLALLTVAATLAIHRDAWRTAWLTIAALLPFAVHLWARHQYYGEWLPNTAYLKVGGWDGRLRLGAAYTADFFLRHAAAAILIIVLVARRQAYRVTIPLAGLVTAYSGYVWYLGGDAFAGGRFFVPVIPMMFALATAGAAAIRSRWTRRLAVGALLLTTPLLWPNRYGTPLPAFWTALAPSPGDVGNIALGRWLRAHTSPDAIVADYWAGTLFYFSQRRGVDLLGKMDPVIARMPVVCEDGLPGHNKYDYAHSLERLQPDFVVAGFKLLPDGTLRGPSGERVPDGDRSSCGMFGALYLHPYFRSEFLPHVATNDGWRTVFRAAR